ncbi:protein geranylgeranyltransferase-like protein type I beta subunit [Halteromyces radiatus]|uniref:protein geranylgeranyltransferase-like protein type I beta subunit n=1 Tax=Halteromyces radiatus TaxID=101107 RepID=UPI002220EB55|nr:protein geranylgeranyltransferase-like protein type I beta subunit [Halteromyces radiatus]KAI8081549.1 protein geranylgeranyltransferase-like protein type I beta subunit [Halteromyces radiatus]
MTDFEREKHIQYFLSNLRMLPSPYTETETNRMTLAYFCLGGLELLGALETVVSDHNKKDWIEWIYAQQILPSEDGKNDPHCGFRGAPWSGECFTPNKTISEYHYYDSSHIANTYTALLNLLLLGDDLSRVNRKAIVNTIRCLQQEDGSIAPTFDSLERDVRFIFCAAAISYILNDWSGLNIERTVEHIKSLQSYEYSIGQCPGEEAHGGSTFCGVAALTLMGKQDEGLLDKDQMVKWCLDRQSTGFQGRPNKQPDTCYCFWIGASLKMLNAFQWINHENLRGFLMTTQTKMGGFGKDDKSFPDVLHSYMGIATLSLLGEPGLRTMDEAVNLPTTGMERLKQNCVFWNASQDTSL